MTRFPAGHPPRTEPTDPADDERQGALLRVPVSSRGWAGRLPPAPDGLRVTVSLSSPSANAEHGEALRFLGYRVVDPSGVDPGGGDVADFVVPAGAAAEHPAWWQAIVGLADRAFPLAFGPVLTVLDRALVPHRAHRPLDPS